MVIHSNFPDFILFVYVHMSEADNNYDPAEMAVIREKMSSLFPAGTDFEKKLYTTIRQYNSFDKSQLGSLFEESFRHFSGSASGKIAGVYQDLQEIILADGKVDNAEARVLEALQKLI